VVYRAAGVVFLCAPFASLCGVLLSFLRVSILELDDAFLTVSEVLRRMMMRESKKRRKEKKKKKTDLRAEEQQWEK